MASVRAPVTPSVLVWARDRAHMPQEVAAKKAAVSLAKLAEWESGASEPTIAQAEKLAEVYKRPVAVFFLPKPPTEFDVLREFRRLPGASDLVSSELATQLRQAVERRSVMLELAEQAGETAPAFKLHSKESDSAEVMAQRLRRTLGIDLTEQRSWGKPDVAYRNWRTAVENAHVIVFHFTDVEVAEARGASIFLEPLPIIGVNSKDSAAGRTFSLFHEIGHLVRGASQVCDPTRQSTRVNIPAETWCNELAGTFLVPSDALLQALQSAGQEDAIAAAESLAKSFGVSREVILRRLLTLRRISRPAYQKWRDQHWEDEWTKVERQKSDRPLIIPQETKALSRLGRAFVASVVDALHDDRITLSTATGLLGVKVKVIPKLEERLSKSAKIDESGAEA